MLIYLLTFLVCVYLDQVLDNKYLFLRQIFLFYLYIFFCFGYTVGTDWRFYENLYNSGSDKFLLNSPIDQGFYYFIYFSRKIIPDFWLFIGLVKSLYLYSLIRIVKIFSSKIFTIIAILMNFQLLFMLVDNPFRFMCGSIFLLFATPYLINRNFIKYYLLSILAISFHYTLVIPVLSSLLVGFRNNTIFKNNYIYIVIYIFASFVSLFPIFIILIREYLAQIIPLLSNKLLDSYTIESNTSNFTIGSLIKLLFFILLIFKRHLFDRIHYGQFLFFMSFLYLTFSRAFMSLPTGFRFSIYFSLFFCIALYFIFINSKFYLKSAIVILIIISMSRELYSSYHFIPYTNSIYYIVFDNHLPYNYRDKFNKNEFNIRTGGVVDEKEYIIP
ncbi:hypothetical protein GCM10027284_02210 [Cyclobacterium sediminis]